MKIPGEDSLLSSTSQREGPGTDPSLLTSEGTNPTDSFGLGPLAARTVRKENTRFTQPVASYCGSPSTLHTATKDFLSHFTQNPNTLPWRSGHLGPARKWPLPPSPSPALAAQLYSLLLRLGPHATSPEACFPWPRHLQQITALTLFFFLAPTGHSDYVFPSQHPSFH